MITILIFLLIFALVAWLGFYIISQMGLPAQPAMIARVALGIILLLVLVQQFAHPFGGYWWRY